MGRFGMYLGKYTVNVEGHELQLDISLDEQATLRYLASRAGELDETLIRKLNSTILGILFKSYPEEPRNELERLYAKNDMAFMMEIYKAFKWISPEIEDKIKKKIEESTSTKGTS